MRVKVNDGWSVYADGEQQPAGAEVDVDQDTADQWISNGWVEPAKPKAKPRTTKRTARP